MKRIVLILILTLASGAIGYWIAPGQSDGSHQSDSKWLNPLLHVDEKPVISKAGYVTTKNEIISIVSKLKSEGKIHDASVFFRDLNQGPTLGINEHANFIPASLLKVPLMLTYLSLAEDNSSLLEEELEPTGFDEDIYQQFAPAETIQIGRSYTIDDLLRRLIVYSDNRAWDILINHLGKISPDQSLLFETYRELGILEPRASTDEIITVKTYSSLFRVLYNASFLNMEYSDKALEYLVQSTFTQGLRQGVPAHIPIANKFGERATENDYQLHDCGIVYFPGNPYLLCVLTSGTDPSVLSELIGTISKIFYEEIESRKL